MNDRQQFAFQNPIVFGRTCDERLFEQIDERKKIMIRTRLTVQAPILYRPGVWQAEGSILDETGKDMLMISIAQEARRVLSVAVSELLDNVGVGLRVMVEAGHKLQISRDLSRGEFEELAQVLNGEEPLSEITRLRRKRDPL